MPDPTEEEIARATRDREARLAAWIAAHPYGGEGCGCVASVWHFCPAHGHGPQCPSDVAPRPGDYRACRIFLTGRSDRMPTVADVVNRQPGGCQCRISVGACPWHNSRVTSQHGAIWYA